MITAIPFPSIDPVLIAIGPLAIRWYALAYIAGLLLGWKYVKIYVAKPPGAMQEKDIDDFLVWATLGVVLGGRIGYVVFYNGEYYLSNPLAILKVWQGGMSFHGGAFGMIAAVYLFARKRGLALLGVGDAIAVAAPVGLFFGRLANFINGELFGRVTDVPWAMVFPHGGPNPRHPSQLYEAFLEGLVLFVLLYFLARNEKIRNRPGVLAGVFFIGYAISRALVELVRQPDIQIGFLAGGFTMGQFLSLPFLLLGIYLLVRRPGHSA
ncbi:MAG: prolipoprotein diacylglyceryl transferase [Rhodospirillales bacterium]|nr:prolipoprotein diacylglyceryl transferase [Rhodospirillales bacterium]